MFITFEGPEGAGKTTAIVTVAARLREDGHAVLVTREPGSGSVGKQIREILLHGEAIDARTELFLFLADRANHVATVIRPALEQGEVVICDRYADSTVVYQSHARGFEASRVRELNELATGSLVPDLTLLLDLDPEIGLKRLSQLDRMDAEPILFHRRVRDGYLHESRREPTRWRVIDATGSFDAVAEQCYANIAQVLSNRQQPLPFEGLG